jgi:hypothetical protein
MTWTDHLVAKLTENPDTHLHLFSNSTETAKTEGCKLVTTNGKTKQSMYEALAKKIWDVEGEKECTTYLSNIPKCGVGVGSQVILYVSLFIHP